MSSKYAPSRSGIAAALLIGLPGMALAQSGQVEFDRTTLPISQPDPRHYTELDVRNTEPPPRWEVTPPEGAPNVLIILVDDLGFGATSTFGGPIPTPTLDQLAQGGLRFNNFHTTSLCSPTRVALKSGRNHHTGNTGSIMETATAYPGNTGRIPNRVAPLAEMLRLNGYSTGAFGKWHETAAWETSVSGPFDRWPTHQGFDKFYGFIGGETDQWSPLIFDGTKRIVPPNGGLSLHRGHDGPGHQLDEGAAVDDARQAVLHVLRYGRHPRAASRAEGVDREVHGKMDEGWDAVRAGAPTSARSRRASSRRAPSCHRARRTFRRGTICPKTTRDCSAARPRCSLASSPIPTTTSAG